jgi:hypothetical protein
LQSFSYRLHLIERRTVCYLLRLELESEAGLRMPTNNEIRFAQAISSGLDREVELLRELLDRTLERIARKCPQAPEQRQLQRSA